MENSYNGQERRQHSRIVCESPLAYKICNPSTLTKLFQGYTINVSETGILCSITKQVNINDVLWLSFNKSILVLFEEVEKNSFFYQNGILGKVVRIEPKENNTFEVGINFITREEPNLTNIYPRTHFSNDNEQKSE